MIPILSSQYPNPQAAIEAGKTSGRPVVLQGVITLTEPLRIVNAVNLYIVAHGATLTCNNELTSLVELDDCKRVVWRGGIFTPNAITQNAFYIFGNTTGTSNIKLSDAKFSGQYVTGVRVGKQGSGIQCDHIYLTNLSLSGGWVAGAQEIYGKYGLYLGSGVHANLLNLSAREINAAGHDIHIEVDSTRYVNLSELGFDRSGSADIETSATMLTVSNVRSEQSKRLLTTVGNGTVIRSTLIQQVEHNAQEIAADGEFIRYHYAGGLMLAGVISRNAPQGIAPVIACNPIAPLTVRDLGVFDASISGNVNVSVL